MTGYNLHSTYLFSRFILRFIVDVQLNVYSDIIHLKTSKTDIGKKEVDVYLFKNGTISCSVHALNILALFRSSNQPSSPFFLVRTGRPLTREAFIGNLKYLLLRIGIQPSFVSTSFRKN